MQSWETFIWLVLLLVRAIIPRTAERDMCSLFMLIIQHAEATPAPSSIDAIYSTVREA